MANAKATGTLWRGVGANDSCGDPRASSVGAMMEGRERATIILYCVVLRKPYGPQWEAVSPTRPQRRSERVRVALPSTAALFVQGLGLLIQ
jgi:hypothetical protein